METGQISVQTENIFPIIKKFLYSDHEIFLRELISNAVDATQKVQKLAALGKLKGELGDLTIEVKLDEKNNTLTVSDKGIGMTEKEVKKYINEIALSSAQEFMDKYKDQEAGKIIGKFGLGFYSAFMVASKVEVITKSHQKAAAVRWACDGSPEYQLEKADRKARGTDVILHIADDSKEFLEKARLEGLLDKYCKFLPVPIQFGTRELKEEDDKGKEKKVVKPNIINNPTPAWTKPPTELTPQDYQDFYKELHPFSEAPLFWIHLNVDYPFHLTGILYFPKVKASYEVQKNKIQLYSRQVFITDQVEEIVPEFLAMLHGVIDSPDIPLNVSRSYLQSDPNVKKISSYISRKVAEKLESLIKDDRKAYEAKWEHINVFVKYGMMTDEKFHDKAQAFCLLENTDGRFFTLEQYQAHIKDNQTDKDNNLIALYTTHAEEQHAFIQAAKDKGYDVLSLETMIDNHFINHLEQKQRDFKFTRVDADTVENLIPKDEKVESVLSEEEEKKLEGLFKETINTPEVTVQLKALSPEDKPVQLTKPEFSRRWRDMAALSGNQMMGAMPEQVNLVVNTNHPLAAKILKARTNQQKLISQLYDLALLSQNMLKGEKLTEFVQRSVALMEK